MQTSFEKNIELIKTSILDIFLTDTLNSFQKLYICMKDNDLENLQSLILNDEILDQKYNKNYDDSVWLIAREHPFASDLRYIIVLLFINRELERVADSSKNVAKIILNNSEIAIPNEYLPHLDAMVTSIINQLKALHKLVKNDNIDITSDIAKSDSLINKIYHEKVTDIFKLLRNVKDIKRIKFYSSILLALKNIERSGDHIIAILEEFAYYKKGVHYELK